VDADFWHPELYVTLTIVQAVSRIFEHTLVSFQVQLLDSGTIIFAYNGILDGPGEDLIYSLDEGIVVGIS